MGRDPYEDLVLLAKDLEVVGVDIDCKCAIIKFFALVIENYFIEIV